MGHSPLTLAGSVQHQQKSPSNCTNASKQRESHHLESCPVAVDGWNPSTVDASISIEQHQVEAAISGSNARTSETRKDQSYQQNTAQVESRTEAGSVDRSRTAQEEEPKSVAEHQDSAVLDQFAADLNELLGKWKGRIAIPGDLFKGIQVTGTNDSNTVNLGPQPQEPQETDHSTETVGQAEVGDMEEPQETPASVHSQHPTTNETLSTRIRVPSEHDQGPSRLSMASSQKSWIDLSGLENHRYRLDVRSPCQDSTYSTCGAGSIYEQQLQELPSDLQFDQRVHRNIEHPVLAITRPTKYHVDGCTSIEPPCLHQSIPQLEPSFRYNHTQNMQEGLEYSVLDASTLKTSTMDHREFDRGSSVETFDQAKNWFSPARSCRQIDSQPSPAPHHSSLRHHFQEILFGNDLVTEESQFALQDSELSEGVLEVGSVTRAGGGEELVGFWKPNKLY